MHSDLMRETVFHDLNHLYPGRITNKTNGITFRRWLMLANPGLTDLLSEACGEAVLDDPDAAVAAWSRWPATTLPAAIPRREACATRSRWRGWSANALGVQLDPGGAVRRAGQAHPRIQAAAAEHRWRRSRFIMPIRARPAGDWVPRVKIFAGKAAASYRHAKLIIKLINDVAAVVNNDPDRRAASSRSCSCRTTMSAWPR